MKSLRLLTILCALATITTQAAAQTFTAVFSFGGNKGRQPIGGFVQNKHGYLFGNSEKGGRYLEGNVFQLNPTTGNINTVYSFTGQADGASPSGPLTLGADGNLYGVNNFGGANNAGIIYRLVIANGRLNIQLDPLYNFCSQPGCTDGLDPVGMIQASDGNFYGATALNPSVIFRLSARGAYQVLYTFCVQSGCPDGNFVHAPFIQANDGNFYGLTSGGGNPDGGTGAGTAFKMSSSGTPVTLYRFCSQPNCTDGINPQGSLMQWSDGNLYGVAGGGRNGEGLVFRLTPAGALSTVYDFCQQPNCVDGATPAASLVKGSNGNLYGVAELGGANGMGTVFEITSPNTLTTIYDFCSDLQCADGAEPAWPLMLAKDGNFYSITSYGGLHNKGEAFRLAP